MKWIKRVGLVIAVGLAIFVFGWAPVLAGRNLHHPQVPLQRQGQREPHPASFQLPYEDVSFNAADGVTLKGWWVPASEPRGTVILVHGLNRSRLEMVRKVPFVHKQGWNALLFDLRHHGDSGGDVSSFGFFEKGDVHAAIALARGRSPGPVVLWGVSLGAASATPAAAEDPRWPASCATARYRSLRDTRRTTLGLFRGFRWWCRIVPTWPVADEAVFWIGTPRRASIRTPWTSARRAAH
jgi:hypothetical protein